MEVLSSNSGLHCISVDLRRKAVRKGLNSNYLIFGRSRKHKFSCNKIISRPRFSLISCVEQFFSENWNLCEGSSKAFSESYNDYRIVSEEDVRRLSETEESVSKVSIPGLPDDSNGEPGASVRSCFWEWKPKLNVYYEKAGCENGRSPALLFLPGFGVGSFHYEKQLKDLGRDYRVWAVDFLGQGMSLSSVDPAPRSKDNSFIEDNSWGFGDEAKPWASELVYSMDLWQDQVRCFIEQVIGEPVYIVGNSLGGYVALYIAACSPNLVKGVTLLNATPFWGFLPNPIRSPRLAKLFPWAGKFPLPPIVKKLTVYAWQKISDPESIREILRQVYADQSIKADELVSRILEITRHPVAAASFASIMLAPQAQLSFQEALSRCHTNDTPICLVYGKEDPWVKPAWGLQIKRQIPEAPYYEISPAGHCPHDEVPEVVNYLLRGWIRNIETQGLASLPFLDGLVRNNDSIIHDLEFMRDGSKKSVVVQVYGSGISLWTRIRSVVQSKFLNSKIKS